MIVELSNNLNKVEQVYCFRGDVLYIQYITLCGATWTLFMSSTVMTWRVLGHGGVHLIKNNTLVLRRQVVYLVAAWRLCLSQYCNLWQSWPHRPCTQAAKTDCFSYPHKETTLPNNRLWKSLLLKHFCIHIKLWRYFSQDCLEESIASDLLPTTSYLLCPLKCILVVIM